MSPDDFFEAATALALVLLTAAMLLAVVRIVRGPSLADRVLALDLIGILVASYAGVVAARSGWGIYADIAVALCLLGFVSTLALTRYLLTGRDRPSAAESDEGRST